MDDDEEEEEEEEEEKEVKEVKEIQSKMLKRRGAQKKQIATSTTNTTFRFTKKRGRLQEHNEVLANAALEADVAQEEEEAESAFLQKRFTKRRKEDTGITVNLQQMNGLLRGMALPQAEEISQQSSSPVATGNDAANNSYFWDFQADLHAKRILEELDENITGILEQQNKIYEAVLSSLSLQKELVRLQGLFKQKMEKTMNAIEAEQLDSGTRVDLQNDLTQKMVNLNSGVEKIDAAEKLSRRVFRGLGNARSWMIQTSGEQFHQKEESHSEGFSDEDETQAHRDHISVPHKTKVKIRVSREEVKRNREETNNYLAELGRRCAIEMGKHQLQLKQQKSTDSRVSSINKTTPTRSTVKGVQRWEFEDPVEGMGHEESPVARVPQSAPGPTLPAGYGHGKGVFLTPTQPRRRLGDGLYFSPSEPLQTHRTPVRLGSDAPSQRTTIPIIGTSRKPRQAPPNLRSELQLEKWPSLQRDTVIVGVGLFWKTGHMWAKLVKEWDENGKGEGANGRARRGAGRGILRFRSVEEIQEMGRQIAEGIVQHPASEESMVMWNEVLKW